MPPVALLPEIRAAVDRWSWRKAARTLRSPQLCAGGLLAGHQKLLGPRSIIDSEHKNSLVAVVAGAIPTTGDVRILEANRCAGIGKTNWGRRSFGKNKVKHGCQHGQAISHEIGTQAPRCKAKARPVTRRSQVKAKIKAKTKSRGRASGEAVGASSHEVGPSPPADLRCPVCFTNEPDYWHMWWECPLTHR